MPSYELVVERVTNGQGGMPSFADTLSEEQIQDVAAYVSSVGRRLSLAERLARLSRSWRGVRAA